MVRKIILHAGMNETFATLLPTSKRLIDHRVGYNHPSLPSHNLLSKHALRVPRAVGLTGTVGPISLLFLFTCSIGMCEFEMRAIFKSCNLAGNAAFSDDFAPTRFHWGFSPVLVFDEW